MLTGGGDGVRCVCSVAQDLVSKLVAEVVTHGHGTAFAENVAALQWQLASAHARVAGQAHGAERLKAAKARLAQERADAAQEQHDLTGPRSGCLVFKSHNATR